MPNRSLSLLLLAGLLLSACGNKNGAGGDAGTPKPKPVRADADAGAIDSRPAHLAEPVDFWEGGATAKQVDAAKAIENRHVLLDLGDDWTPYLFTDRGNAAEDPKPNAYRSTYLALAKERFPKDEAGDRPRRDKYLELYGIMPTLSVLRKRFDAVSKLECAATLDLTPFNEFSGTVVYSTGAKGQREASEYGLAERLVARLMEQQKAATVDVLDVSKLSSRDQVLVTLYKNVGPKVRAIRAVQKRLRCEGFAAKKARMVDGVLDWGTRDALAEFERRHRVYGWGILGGSTLEALRRTPMQNEQEAVIRILTERAMHADGVIEDGSIPAPQGQTAPSYTGQDGKQHALPNLELELRNRIIASFGLQTPESTLKWLQSAGDLAKGEHLVAFQGPPLPEYYNGNMDLSVEIDRGDVWYDFPFGPDGREKPQPVDRRPRTTIITTYLGQRIPLARFGTTIGGWRSELVNGNVMWKYKNSPDGEVIWTRIVGAPVWLPPDTTPPTDIVKKGPGGVRYINYDEMGPGYASAYGLVAAYHYEYRMGADGKYVVTGDDGIRSHGSVDYMSIMRRHSHGCHRLHNHIALRLMSFVLAHRKHRRTGEQMIDFKLPLNMDDGEPFLVEIDKGGYIFTLEEPVHVKVLEGRIRGSTKDPVVTAIPKYNADAGAYVLPDGGAVAVNPDGVLTPIPMPVHEIVPGTLGDGGVPPAAAPPTVNANGSPALGADTP